MAKIQGFNMALAIGTNASNLAVVAASKNCSLSIDKEMIERAPVSAGFRSYMPGMTNWSISADGLYAMNRTGDTKPMVDIATRLKEGTKLYLLFFTEYTYTNPATRDITIYRDKYSGTAYVQSLQVSGGIEGIATYSIQLQGSGALAVERTSGVTANDLTGTFDSEGTSSSGGTSGGSIKEDDLPPLQEL